MSDLFSLRVGSLRFVVYSVATPRWTFARNSYSGHTIGWALVTGRYCWSFVFRSAP